MIQLLHKNPIRQKSWFSWQFAWFSFMCPYLYCRTMESSLNLTSSEFEIICTLVPDVPVLASMWSGLVRIGSGIKNLSFRSRTSRWPKEKNSKRSAKAFRLRCSFYGTISVPFRFPLSLLNPSPPFPARNERQETTFLPKTSLTVSPGWRSIAPVCRSTAILAIRLPRSGAEVHLTHLLGRRRHPGGWRITGSHPRWGLHSWRRLRAWHPRNLLLPSGFATASASVLLRWHAGNMLLLLGSIAILVVLASILASILASSVAPSAGSALTVIHSWKEEHQYERSIIYFVCHDIHAFLCPEFPFSLPFSIVLSLREILGFTPSGGLQSPLV